MAEQEPIVLDISSDEDVGWGNITADCSGGGGGVRDDLDWLSELLGDVGKGTDDSDEEVVVVGEVIAKPKLRVAKSLVSCVNKIDNDDDDDECMVLDGDPDKPAAIEHDIGEDDSEEVVVVSEKGQVACRDYPHARHLCAKFPFNSTPHNRHCNQCHCFVCDSLAPCPHWSTSFSSIDHCHATDKDEFWKAQRRSSKENDKVPPVTSGVPDASFSKGLASPLAPDPSSQNQLLLTQAAHQLSFVPTSNGTQNNATHGRRQQSGNYMRNKYDPHSISQQLRTTYGNGIPRDRRHGVGNAGTHFISHVPFKRTGTFGGVLPTNRVFCNNTSRFSLECQFPRSHPTAERWLDPPVGVTPVMSTYQDSSRGNVGGMSTSMMSTSMMSNLPGMTSMVNGTANQSPSQPHTFPRTHGSSVNANTLGSQHQLSSPNFNFTNPVPTQPGVATQPNWDCPFDTSYLFQPQATSNPYDASIYQDPVPSEPLQTCSGNMCSSFESAAPTQPNADSGFENPLPHQPQACSLPASLSNHRSDAFQQGNRTQSTLHPSSAECGFSWESAMSHSKQPLVVEYNQLENAGQREEPAVNVCGISQLSGSTNSSLVDFQLDPWVFGDHAPLEGHVFSPEAAPIDSGIFEF